MLRSVIVASALLALTGCNSLLGIDSDADIKAIRKTAEETCAPYAKFGELEHMKCVDREYSWRVNAAYGR